MHDVLSVQSYWEEMPKMGFFEGSDTNLRHKFFVRTPFGVLRNVLLHHLSYC